MYIKDENAADFVTADTIKQNRGDQEVPRTETKVPNNNSIMKRRNTKKIVQQLKANKENEDTQE